MFDPECRRLAEHFLPSAASDKVKDALAQEIQTRIEDFLEFESRKIANRIRAADAP